MKSAEHDQLKEIKKIKTNIFLDSPPKGRP
jgi:hypothetical protein